jgi:hypothetical protein
MKTNKLLFIVLLLAIFCCLGARTLVNLAQDVTSILPVANGGTATATPNLVAGTNVTISGTWPNQTINATNSGGGGTISGGALSYGGTYCTRSTTSSATSQNCSSTYNVEANQLVVATAGWFAGNCTGTPAIADTLGGGLTWHQIGTACNSTSHVMETAWWATPGGSTGADTFTVSCSGCNDGSGANGFGFMGMTVSEAIGASLTSPIDASVTVTGAGLQSFDLTGYSSTSDLIFLGFDNTGTSATDPNMFTILNDTFEANAVQHAQLGPYHMRPNLGTNGAGVAFAIH